MKWNLHHKIVATILYSQLFNAILTEDELRTWLIGNSVVSVQKFNTLRQEFVRYQQYLLLNKKSIQDLIRKRKDRLIQSKNKLVKVPRVTKYLSLIPSIELIGVSGGLAMQNVDESDDIDLFFIVSPGTIWITRFLVLVILELLRVRRRYGSKNEQDLFCPNMFLSRLSLAIPKKSRDLYSAHEVLQMIPVFNRDHCYADFLQANLWVNKYLANAWEEVKRNKRIDLYTPCQTGFSGQFRSGYLQLLRLINPWFRLIQLWYMQPHKTREVVSETILQFHPYDIRSDLWLRYKTLLKKYNIPLDSPFLKSLQ